jgi:hypothetical protein
MLPEYATGRVRPALNATIVLSVLGVCLVGCTSMKDDPPRPCDPAARQQQGMASLSPTQTGCPSLVRPTYDSDH